MPFRSNRALGGLQTSDRTVETTKAGLRGWHSVGCYRAASKQLETKSKFQVLEDVWLPNVLGPRYWMDLGSGIVWES